MVPFVRDLQPWLPPQVWCSSSCYPLLCVGLAELGNRGLGTLQSSMCAAHPPAAAPSREKEGSWVCCWLVQLCSVRYENLPGAFLLFYFYSYVLTACHLQIKAGVCSLATAAELCLLLICCLLKLNIYGARDSSLLHLKSFSLLHYDDFSLCILTQLL